MRRTTRAWLACALAIGAWIGCAVAAAQELAIIELRHRRAEDVIAVVQPLVEPGGVVSGVDNKLLVRTTPANLAEIRAAVEAIDRPQRQLLITVGQGTVADSGSARARGAATIGGGDVQVGVNRPPSAQSGVQASVRGSSQQATLSNVSSVRTLEGSETWIAVGQSVPFTTTTVTPGWNGSVQRSTTFRDVSTGFFATVRLNGDVVTLEISPRQQQLRPSAAGGTVNTQGANTVVSGRLGEWMQVGAVREASSGAEAGLLVWGRQTGRTEYSAWVKVDAVP
jgi:type II secretory pathway component GspD/PulD (secretin)